MGYKISKELLSEVISGSKKVFDSDIIICIDRVTLRYGILEENDNISYFNINIYELAHKCKEWASEQGYILLSKPRTNSSKATCCFDINGRHDYEDDFHNDFRADSEQQAVFDACQWILDNICKK